MLPDKMVKPLYDKVMTHLTERHPYGEYFAMREIFGDRLTMEVVKRGEIMAPPSATGGLVERVRPVGNSRIEPIDVDDDDDTYMP